MCTSNCHNRRQINIKRTPIPLPSATLTKRFLHRTSKRQIQLRLPKKRQRLILHHRIKQPTTSLRQLSRPQNITLHLTFLQQRLQRPSRSIRIQHHRNTPPTPLPQPINRSEEHTSELQSRAHL